LADRGRSSALTYGIVALAIVPFGALDIPWNAWTALFALAVVSAIAWCLRIALGRVRDVNAEACRIRGSALVVRRRAAGRLADRRRRFAACRTASHS
jgi:hypothetical protein